MVVASPLKHVDPNRTPGLLARAYAALATTRFANFVSRHLNWKLDPFLLRITGGRFATTLFFPTGLLETRGARSGAPRRNAIIYFNDGARFVIVASNAGSARNPAWYHNVIAHPDVVFGGVPMRAAVVVDDDERARLSTLGDRVFPAFARYRQHAAELHRTVPIVVLMPRSSHQSSA
jgi:deazaflavin-dependent oxidoreductase (nitroreductase family)